MSDILCKPSSPGSISPDPDWFSGSRTSMFWNQKYENKKVGVSNYLNYSSNTLRWRPRIRKAAISRAGLDLIAAAGKVAGFKGARVRFLDEFNTIRTVGGGSGGIHSLRFFALYSKNLHTTHTWNILTFPNFLLRIPLWNFFFEKFCLHPVTALLR